MRGHIAKHRQRLGRAARLYQATRTALLEEPQLLEATLSLVHLSDAHQHFDGSCVVPLGLVDSDDFLEESFSSLVKACTQEEHGDLEPDL